ncbi:MAG: enoyl-CoA hydratase-related protein, partial [Pseudomonadota bacterium]
MTDFETITVDQHRAVATITLRRPEAGNALNSPMRRELTAVFGSIADTARAVLLTGAGPRFCAGQDLGGAANFKALDLESALLDETLPLVQQIAKCPRPVICAVNGLAAGAGANLALASDIVIAAHSASFLQANVLAGMIPDTGGTYFLPRRVGVARAMALSLTGEAVSAEQAADWGLIWKAVADDDLMEEANALADRLAEGPADAHASIKQAIGV